MSEKITWIVSAPTFPDVEVEAVKYRHSFKLARDKLGLSEYNLEEFKALSSSRRKYPKKPGARKVLRL